MLLAAPLLFSAVHGWRGIAGTNRLPQAGRHDSRILVRAVDRLVEGLDREAADRIEALRRTSGRWGGRPREREKEVGVRFEGDLAQAQALPFGLVFLLGLAGWLAYGILREWKGAGINA